MYYFIRVEYNIVMARLNVKSGLKKKKKSNHKIYITLLYFFKITS